MASGARVCQLRPAEKATTAEEPKQGGLDGEVQDSKQRRQFAKHCNKDEIP